MCGNNLRCFFRLACVGGVLLQLGACATSLAPTLLAIGEQAALGALLSRLLQF